VIEVATYADAKRALRRMDEARSEIRRVWERSDTAGTRQFLISQLDEIDGCSAVVREYAEGGE